MKKILAIIFCITMLVSVTACSSKDESLKSKTTSQAEKTTVGDETTSSTSDNAEVKDNGEVGYCTVAIKSAKFIKDSDSVSDVVIVTFEYTNNDDKDRSFNGELFTSVSQDGENLGGAPLVEDPDFLYEDNFNKLSKKGDKIQVQQAYKLKNITSPVKVNVKELIFASDKPDMVEKTFEITK